MNSEKYDSRPYKISRMSYIVQDGVEYFATILVADAFLAKLLGSLGLDDASIGIISSTVSFAYLIQLLTICVQSGMGNIKRVIVITKTLGMFLLTGVYFLPLLSLSRQWNTVLTFVFVAGGFLSRYFSATLHYQWCNSFVPNSRLARFTSLREAFSLISSTVVSLWAGTLVDRYEAQGDLDRAFLIIGISLLAFSLIDLVMLLITSDNRQVMHFEKRKGNSAVRELMRNRAYVSIFIMEGLAQVGIYLTLSFLGTYKTQELGFSVWSIQIYTMLSSLVRMLISVPLGRFADRSSMLYGYLAGVLIMAAGFFVLTFTTPDSRWLMVVHIILYNAAWAGMSVNCANLMLDYVPYEYYSQALSLQRSIGGLIGFAAAIAGGVILNAVNRNGGCVMGISAYPQQVLGLISAAVLAVVLLYGLLVVNRQPKIKS